MPFHLSHKSAWCKLYASKNDQEIMILIGCDFNSFNAICKKFAQKRCLQMLFRLTMINPSIYLWFGQRIVIHVLKNDLDATIYLPTDIEMQKYTQQFCENILVWVQRNRCIIVGLKLMLQQAPNSMIQEQVYNDWIHDHYVISLFVFVLMGYFPLLHSICQDPFMTALLQSMEVFMQSWW